ncbi:response regulator [Rhizobium leguminosarum]|uniref:response regulator n=1 Tax=Rhizobium leguminosarum TaxID=384 RepID=UPI001C945529|nr:response regulator [Rhizobium leguminosarum]MBY5533664.1 response regulator [Rhizobium leguminosarum]
MDDDLVMRQMLVEVLGQAGYVPYSCSNGHEFNRLMEEVSLDLVIVEMNLAGEDGFDIVKRVAKQETIPIIVVTGERITDADKVIGLEFGADDYIKKPFGTGQFLARVRTCLRGPALLPQEKLDSSFSFCGWSFNLRRMSLTDPTGMPVELSANEFRVLRALVRSPQTILSREQLLRSRGPSAVALDPRSVDVAINRLRRKLDRELAGPSMIRTERGFGYSFMPSVEQVETGLRCRDRDR